LLPFFIGIPISVFSDGDIKLEPAKVERVALLVTLDVSEVVGGKVF
jgi:hypothetical protein